MSSKNVVVEIAVHINNGTRTVSLDCLKSAKAWQVAQMLTQILTAQKLSDGEGKKITSENIILRSQQGFRLRPTNRINTCFITKDKKVHLIAEIMERDGVKKNRENGNRVKRSMGGASSVSEDSNNINSTNQPTTLKEKHQGGTVGDSSPTENKRRKIQRYEAGNLPEHKLNPPSKRTGSKADVSSPETVNSTKPRDGHGGEVLTNSPAKRQQEGKRCPECGSTGDVRATLQLGFKRNHGFLVTDKSPSSFKVNLSLSQRCCSACPSSCNDQENSTSDSKLQKKMLKKIDPGVNSFDCTSTEQDETHPHEKTRKSSSTEVCKAAEKSAGKCVELKSKISSTKVSKESSGSSADESAQRKSRYFTIKSDKISVGLSNESLEVKRKSAKIIRSSKYPAINSVEPRSNHSTKINDETGGSLAVESADSSSGCLSTKISKGRRPSVEIVLNTNSLQAKIIKNVEVRKSTNDVANSRLNSKHSTQTNKHGKVSADLGVDTITVRRKTTCTKKVAVERSTNKAAERDANCSSTTDAVDKTAGKSAAGIHRKQSLVVSTEEAVDLVTSTERCIDIVAKHFECAGDEENIQEKFNLINLRTVGYDRLGLVENIGESNDYVDGLYEPPQVIKSDSKVQDLLEKSFVDDAHDDEINSIHTEDCDSEEHRKEVCSSSYVEEDAVVINIGRNELRRSDLDTLHEGEWLNDCVINAYFILLGEASPLNIFSHSSFFFFSLYKRGYEGVKRWTKNADLFAQDIIFIPVHNKSHWTLVAVHVKEGVIEYYNSSTFHDGYASSLKYIQDYLKEEAVHRGKTEFCTFEWKMFILDRIPRQQNSDDCGLFICQYAKKMCLEQKIKFNAEKTNSLRQQMLHELLHEEIDKNEPQDGTS